MFASRDELAGRCWRWAIRPRSGTAQRGVRVAAFATLLEAPRRADQVCLSIDRLAGTATSRREALFAAARSAIRRTGPKPKCAQLPPPSSGCLQEALATRSSFRDYARQGNEGCTSSSESLPSYDDPATSAARPFVAPSVGGRRPTSARSASGNNDRAGPPAALRVKAILGRTARLRLETRNLTARLPRPGRGCAIGRGITACGLTRRPVRSVVDRSSSYSLPKRRQMIVSSLGWDSFGS